MPFIAALGITITVIMATLYEILPDANAIISLEPEELAGLVLELLNSSGPNAPSRLHPAGLSSPETIGAFAPAMREQLEFVLAEGWHWLVHGRRRGRV